MSDNAQKHSFEPDPRLQEVAEAYTLDAIDMAKGNFGITLDRSEASIAQVERILDELHQATIKEAPSPETIETVSKMFGSYIGEVFRQHHSGEWGFVTMGGGTVPGIKAPKNMFWPWLRVSNRLENGSEDNVWHYYQVMVQKQTGDQGKVIARVEPGRPPQLIETSKPPETPAKKGLLGRLFGRDK